MKTRSYTLRKVLCWKDFHRQASRAEAACCSDQRCPESRINTLQLQTTAAQQHEAKSQKVWQVTAQRDPEDNGQWGMRGGRGGGSRGPSPPHSAGNKTTTTAALGTDWQGWHDVKTRSLWEMNTNSSCQALQKRKKLNWKLWWAHILKRILSCGQRKFYFFSNRAEDYN